MYMYVGAVEMLFSMSCMWMSKGVCAQGQTWSAMLRVCGHPDQQITGLWF